MKFASGFLQMGYLHITTLALCSILAACGSISAAKQPGKSDAPVDVPPAVLTAFDSAVLAQRAQQWLEAERQLKQLAEKYPQFSGPQLNLALVYAQTQRPQQADESFKRALQINPNNVSAANQYGIWLRSQARFADAETVYQQALTRNPDNAETHLDLAILYDLYMGKLPQALEHYQRYLALIGDEKSPVQSWIADLQRRMKAG